MGPSRDVTAIVADLDRKFRRILRSEVVKAGMTVLGEASSGDSALEAIIQARPTVALVDMLLPGITGIDVIRHVRRIHLDTRVVLVSTFDRDEWIRQAVEAGAAAVISKRDRWQEYVRLVAEAPQTAIVMSPRPLRFLVDEYIRLSASKSPEDSLTAREMQIARLVALGLGNKEIAQRLSVSVRTIENVRYRMMKKIGASSIVDVVRYVDTHLMGSGQEGATASVSTIGNVADK